jgi:hypothetical protein
MSIHVTHSCTFIFTLPLLIYLLLNILGRTAGDDPRDVLPITRIQEQGLSSGECLLKKLWPVRTSQKQRCVAVTPNTTVSTAQSLSACNRAAAAAEPRKFSGFEGAPSTSALPAACFMLVSSLPDSSILKME